uniref:Uncharacterized protein n=1 Tax=Romanomermis culicivorax TaxID=13658 RepID=A0A915JC76_ROMCU
MVTLGHMMLLFSFRIDKITSRRDLPRKTATFLVVKKADRDNNFRASDWSNMTSSSSELSSSLSSSSSDEFSLFWLLRAVSRFWSISSAQVVDKRLISSLAAIDASATAFVNSGRKTESFR